MKSLALGIGWVATIAVAFFAGQNLAGTGSDGGVQTLDRPSTAADLPATEPSLEGRADLPVRRSEAAPDAPTAGRPAPDVETLAAKDLEDAQADLETFLRALQDPDKASLLLRARFAALLEKGKAGHIEAVQLLDQLMKDQSIQRMFGGSDEQAARHIYPWIKFLVHREAQIVDLTETVFETMAENPQRFEGMDDDSLEIFTEGMAMMLPGVVGEKRIERLRGYAEAVLEAPEDTQPEAVSKNRSELKRVLEMWAPPKTTEEILQLLQGGDVDARMLRKYLPQLKPEDLQTVDLTHVLVPLVEKGDYSAIRAIESAGGALAGLGALDDALLAGAAKGQNHAWTVQRYLRATKRGGWPAAQGLVEAGLGRGERATDVFAQVLWQLNPRPDASYVQSVLDGYPLSKGTRNTLRARFKIE